MATPPQSYDVFISYCRKDAARASMVRDKLQSLGLSVFFDSEGIEGGAEFTDVLDRAVKNAKVVLACWTHEALERRWVRIESRIGLDRGTLIATALEPMSHSDLPAEFYNVNVVDLSSFNGDDDHPGWQGVLRSTGRKVGRPDLGGGAPADVPLIGDAPVKRPRYDRKIIIAAVVLGLVALAAGGWLASALLGGGPDAASRQELVTRFEAQVAAADPILEAGAEGRISEISTQAFPRSVWAAAQLVAVAPDIPDDVRRRYEQTMAEQLDSDCRCIIIDGAPLTVVQAWILLSYVDADRALPEGALDALLQAQNPRGWWSSALDADDQASNASLYVTAMVALTLSRVEPAVSGAARERVRDARRRAITWLRTLRASEAGLWADYPDNAQRNENVVFSAMVTILLLEEAQGAEATRIATQYLNALSEISAPDRNFSFDTLVTHHDGVPYVDTFRHLPMGWETHALAVAYRHLEPQDQSRAAALLAQAAAYPLDDPALARQEWIIAEAVFGLRAAAAALNEG